MAAELERMGALRRKDLHAAQLAKELMAKATEANGMGAGSGAAEEGRVPAALALQLSGSASSAGDGGAEGGCSPTLDLPNLDEWEDLGLGCEH